MKLISLIIRPFKLEDIHDALWNAGVQGLTVTEVKGFLRNKSHTEHYRGAEYVVDFVSKVKLDIAVDDSLVDKVIAIITEAAKTQNGEIGEGKAFIYELTDVIRLRTGETGLDAL
uniref:Nitrogen regulatory protein P-II family n=1 Tax=Candidatus Kentrum sp. DK TaxID=2126562 RepID=A0A450RW19_9GAMM|nr:MAG: nitrogen regulatory protein P-II family [Candidatus Kentron sp. DK]